MALVETQMLQTPGVEGLIWLMGLSPLDREWDDFGESYVTIVGLVCKLITTGALPPYLLRRAASYAIAAHFRLQQHGREAHVRPVLDAVRAQSFEVLLGSLHVRLGMEPFLASEVRNLLGSLSDTESQTIAQWQRDENPGPDADPVVQTPRQT